VPLTPEQKDFLAQWSKDTDRLADRSRELLAKLDALEAAVQSANFNCGNSATATAPPTRHYWISEPKPSGSPGSASPGSRTPPVTC
jgi:hypothetical protein